MNDDSVLKEYYDRRAEEYERIYQKPERQGDLAWIREELRRCFAGHEVFEVACGTGFWTAAIAETARSVLASDQSTEVLEVARAKGLTEDRVKFVQGDAYAPRTGGAVCDGGFAGFWWSHVPKARLREFLQAFHGVLRPGAKVVFVDNLFVEGSSTPISRADEEGNTYQLRPLVSGARYEVLKNFPSKEELLAAVSPFSKSAEVRRSKFFWVLEYRLCE